MFNPITNYNFRVFSNDKTSYIAVAMTEYVYQHLPSLCCTIDVLDNKFSGWNTDVWFSLTNLHSFINALETLEITRQGKACLSAMSNEEFKITFESYNKKGDIVVFYSLSNQKYNSEIPIKNTMSGGFQIDSEYLSKVITDCKKFSVVSELKSDIEFY